MKNSIYKLIIIFFIANPIFGQNFSSRKILIEDLGSRISNSNVINVEDVVYTKILNGEIHFISHIDGQLNLYKPSDGMISYLGNIGKILGFIVDTYDHNSDGLTDILGHLQIKLGKSEISFEDEMTPVDGSFNGRIHRATDFNGDGIVDILTRHLVFSAGSFTETIYIYILNNENQIESTLSFITNEELTGAQLFDHNLDGNIDLAYIVDIFGDNRLIIQTNNGDGSFTKQDIEVSNPELFIIAEDFDNDLDLDIVITGFNGRDVEILFNEGGLFSESDKIIDTEIIFCIKAADLDSDDNLDLVYLENENFDSLKVMLANGLGDGSFASPIEIGKVAFNGVSYNSLAQAAEDWISLSDYDGDGDLDILVNAILEQKFLVFENMGSATSTNIVQDDGSMYLFPNPVSTLLNMETERVPKQIEIMGINGHRLISGDHTTQIDVSSLPSGIYIIKITDFMNKVSVSKFIKEK